MLKINLTQVGKAYLDGDKDITDLIDEFKQREQTELTEESRDLYFELKSSLRPHFPEEEFNEMQVASLIDTVVSHVQIKVADRLDEIFPEEFYARLDTYLDDGDITPEQVPAIIDHLYTVFTDGSIVEYARAQALEFIPQLKAEVLKYKQQYMRLSELSENDQKRFIDLVAREDFASAEALLGSAGK